METQSEMFNPQSGDNVLVLGNGFDLDLGLKTSYNDFYKSELWPFRASGTLMGAYLKREQSLNNWMDLEEKIGEYAVRSYFNDFKDMGAEGKLPKDNLSDYNLVIKSLSEYLLQAERGPINKESIAASVFKSNMESLFPPTIITFNYTNIESIARRIGISQIFIPQYVHGNLVKRNIILGVGENYTYKNYKLPKENDFLYKASSPNYAPPQFSRILSQASHITFFGLSLGKMDISYFTGLFQALSNTDGKALTFFTDNEDSRLQILRNLRVIESFNLNDVRIRHKFEFIRTKDNMDSDKIGEYVQRLNNWELAV
ncbi:MAG: bacteriophage abortive infection AbiH family protein [Bacteroidales bacterium]|nr:bacteriophage abortive infection AbiH family protein [Bacteroidales bacterium]